VLPAIITLTLKVVAPRGDRADLLRDRARRRRMVKQERVTSARASQKSHHVWVNHLAEHGCLTCPVHHAAKIDSLDNTYCQIATA